MCKYRFTTETGNFLGYTIWFDVYLKLLKNYYRCFYNEIGLFIIFSGILLVMFWTVSFLIYVYTCASFVSHSLGDLTILIIGKDFGDL